MGLCSSSTAADTTPSLALRLNKRADVLRCILSFHETRNPKEYIDLRSSSKLFHRALHQPPPLWTHLVFHLPLGVLQIHFFAQTTMFLFVALPVWFLTRRVAVLRTLALAIS